MRKEKRLQWIEEFNGQTIMVYRHKDGRKTYTFGNKEFKSMAEAKEFIVIAYSPRCGLRTTFGNNPEM